MIRLSSKRVALLFLKAEWDKLAKPAYLKALDFTAGLIRKFNSRGQRISSEASNEDLLRRILKMRSMVQDGFDLGLLVRNDQILAGIGAKALLRAEVADRMSDSLLPKEMELQHFIKTFPNNDRQARAQQGHFLQSLISRELKVDLETLKDGVITDRVLFNEAFSIVNAYVRGVKPRVSGLLSGAPGIFGIRDKAEQSTWDKSTKKSKVPFYYLGDLLGCRSVTTTIPEMAKACAVAQGQLDIVSKDNRYLASGGDSRYNAVHYAMMVDHVVVEYQVKALVNKLEAAMSHELIYSDDKFRDKFKTEPLPPAEKALIKRVLDVSTQLSMSDISKYFELPLETRTAPEGADVLYGPDLAPGELEKRLHLAELRLRRFAQLGIS